jgi:hypothetical protein
VDAPAPTPDGTRAHADSASVSPPSVLAPPNGS